MGRVMYVGDWHQAIYGFSGSDAQSMATMAASLEGTPQGLVSLPLTVTRRCPRLVTAYARRLVPEIECLPNASTGHVCLGHSYLELVAPETLVAGVVENDLGYKFKIVKYPEEQHLIHIGHEGDESACNDACYTGITPGWCKDTAPERGDMILCRLNAPLIAKAYEFIRANKPCKIQGRDIGKNLADLIKRLVPSGSTTDELDHALTRWYDKEYAHIMKNYANSESRLENALAALQDKIDCIKALMEGLQRTDEVLSRISVLFADVEKGNTQGFILLSSIHKAKGLEAPTVRIINPESLNRLGRLPWQKEQERNLEYVAVTRSLNALHIHD